MKYTGYTLIELIVVISLLAIVVTIGLVSWTNYQDKEFINSQTQDLVFWLRSIRSQALFGQKPSQNCESLIRYKIEADGRVLKAIPICNNGENDYANKFSIHEEIEEFTLNNSSFSFLSNSGGVDEAVTINLEYRNNETEIEITKSGKVSWEIK